jgi:hypothetical protein
MLVPFSWIEKLKKIVFILTRFSSQMLHWNLTLNPSSISVEFEEVEI